MGNYVEKNLGKEESVIMEAPLHWMILFPHVLLFFMIVGFFTIWGALIRKFTTELAFTNKKIIGKVGLINTKSLDTPLNKINNVTVESGLWGKIFGYGDIHITTSSGSYSFKGIVKPENFKIALLNQIDQFDEDRIKKQASELANAINK